MSAIIKSKISTTQVSVSAIKGNGLSFGICYSLEEEVWELSLPGTKN